MFEPGRLGDLYLTDVYERLVPVVRRAPAAPRLGSKREAMPQRQESQR